MECDMCGKVFKTELWISRHIRTQHLKQYPLLFDCFAEFESWKVKEERDTRTQFVIVSRKKNKGAASRVYYKCSRSQDCNNRKRKELHELKRAPKMQGTKKTSKCKARINVKINVNGSCYVTYDNIHVDHGHELKHLTLSKMDRSRIAEKIGNGVDYSKILEDVKKPVDGMSLSRIDLTKRLDLHNIARSYNLTSKMSRYDPMSVERFKDAPPEDSIQAAEIAKEMALSAVENLRKVIQNSDLDKNMENYVFAEKQCGEILDKFQISGSGYCMNQEPSYS